jgi:DNA-binding beta-propeller fold protein YncE
MPDVSSLGNEERERKCNMKAKLSVIFAVILATAIPCMVRGQAGPQDHWVVEPDLQFGSGILNGPRGIAVDTQFIYVADYGNNKIKVFTKQGAYTNSWGTASTGSDGSYHGPIGIALDSTNAYVVEWLNDRVQVLNKSGAFLRKWGTSGSGVGQFYRVTGIAMDSNYVYVADAGNYRVQVFTKDGIFVRQWGSQGSVLGQFNGMSGITVDERYVYVIEVNNARVQVFTKDGSFVRSWILPVNTTGGNGSALFIVGISVDTHCVYVSYGFRWDANGAPATAIIAYDKYGGILWKYNSDPFSFPSSIAVDNPFIYIADYGGSMVQPMRRIYRTLGALQPNPIPQADVWTVTQRNGAAVLDVDYLATDENDSNVTVYAAAFNVGTNATPSLNDIIPMRTFIEGTATNIGPGISTGVPHRLSWDMGADGVTNKIAQWGNLKVSLMAKDQRGLLDLHFLSIPAIGTNATFKISRDALQDTDLLPLLFWWLSAGDTNLALNAGQVVGVGGAFDGQLLAAGTNTTAAGRSNIFSRLNLRVATATELQVAREGTTPGTVLQWTPRREPPATGSKVNALNFVTSPTNGWWVVPLP